MEKENEQRNKILIVDADGDAAEALGGALAQAGYSCLYAQDGRSGLLKALQHRPAAVITDLNLPVLNGFYLLKYIKMFEPVRDVPVLIHTAVKDRSSIVSAVQLGAADFMTKPTPPDQAAGRAAAAIQKQKAPPERMFEFLVCAASSNGSMLTLHLFTALIESSADELRDLFEELTPLMPLPVAIDFAKVEDIGSNVAKQLMDIRDRSKERECEVMITGMDKSRYKPGTIRLIESLFRIEEAQPEIAHPTGENDPAGKQLTHVTGLLAKFGGLKTLHIQASDMGGMPMLECSGTLNAHTFPAMESALGALKASAGSGLLVQIDRLTEADDAGLKQLAGRLKILRETANVTVHLVARKRWLVEAYTRAGGLYLEAPAQIRAAS